MTSLSPGDAVGPYHVLQLLGKGGMGEVWRARDAKLDRDVAIKALPEALASHADTVARFEREARILASLKHQSVAGVYGLEAQDGALYLVMECVDGETLAVRLARGRLVGQDVLEIMRQVADGLEAAHTGGVIHRDLKPGNIQVAASNDAKILDFGLARAFDTNESSTDKSFYMSAGDPEPATPSMAPDVPHDVSTTPGTLLGTVPYMSPEQARGQTVDRRTDIWSFGCILYECLTGQRPFRGETRADLLGAILSDEPDWSQLPDDVPPTIALLIRRCLAKDRRKRLQDIGDARVELEHVIDDPSSSAFGLSPVARSSRRALMLRWAPWALLAVVGAWLLSALLGANESTTALEVTRFRISPTDRPGWRSHISSAMALAPQRREMITVRKIEETEKWQLCLRRFDQLGGVPIPETEGAFYPTFAADGKRILFTKDQVLFRMTLPHGAPEKVIDDTVLAPSWGDDGTIVFERDGGAGLRIIAPGAAAARPLTTLDAAQGERGHSAPQVLPGSRKVLFTVHFTAASKKDPEIRLVDLEDRSTSVLLKGGLFARYVPPGFLIYQRRESLLAVPVALESGRVTGDPILCAEGLLADMFLGPSFVVANGTLVYSTEAVGKTLPVWLDRDGSKRPISERLTARKYAYLTPSPDGSALAAVLRDPSGYGRYVVIDAARDTMRSLSKDWAEYFRPLWSPRPPYEIVFTAGTSVNDTQLYRVPADASTAPRLLLENAPMSWTGSWSKDGTMIMFDAYGGDGGEGHVMIAHLEDPVRVERYRATGKPTAQGMLSPDQRWMAFMAVNSGADEIYVSAYPNAGPEIQISTSGGAGRPRWSPDGRTLYYESLRGIMAVPITFDSQPRSGRHPRPGTPRLHIARPSPKVRFAELSPDRERVIVLNPEHEDERPRWTVVLNFTEELKQR